MRLATLSAIALLAMLIPAFADDYVPYPQPPVFQPPPVYVPRPLPMPEVRPDWSRGTTPSYPSQPTPAERVRDCAWQHDCAGVGSGR